MNWHQGRRAEAKFAQQYELIRWASTKEDIYEHWDGIFLIGGLEKRVDIKSQKSVNRGERASEDFTWVELLNVEGKPGWLLGGADIIAFEHGDGFILVDRIALLLYTLRALSPDLSKSPYTLYRRKDRRDLMVLIDLKKAVQWVAIFTATPNENVGASGS